jgi:uncharacterized damage-inducible protein DinB
MTIIDDHGRPEPSTNVDEAGTIVGFLEYQRATFAWKCANLDAKAFNVTVGASTMTLGGMMKHLALVEDYWFSQWLEGEESASPWSTANWDADPDWDWHSAVDDSPERLRRLWSDSVERSRHLVGAAIDDGGLGQSAKRTSPEGFSPSLRWIIVHMIEEYARHNGHADLIREAIDGQTGE